MIAASRSRWRALEFVAGDSLAAGALRRLLPAVVLSVALAVLYRAAEDPASASLGGLWVIAGGAGALLAVLGWSAMAHARSEARRRAAERALAERDAYIAGERTRVSERVNEQVNEQVTQQVTQQVKKQLEERVDERISELQAINEQLEAFSYSIAHDLRAPLRSIATFSQALQDDHAEQLDPGGLEFLTHIHRASQRMGHLIDDLLNFSRVTRSQLSVERVDMSLLASAVIGRLRFMHPDREVETIVEDGLVVMADPRALDIVLTNLLGNAWKFTAKRDHARIELAAVAGEPGTYVVRDNGVGFDPAQAGRMFGVFQRLHPAHEFEGTGIGLATVQRLVLRHGGKVWAEGEVGRGASVYFTLGAA